MEVARLTPTPQGRHHHHLRLDQRCATPPTRGKVGVLCLAPEDGLGVRGETGHTLREQHPQKINDFRDACAQARRWQVNQGQTGAMSTTLGASVPHLASGDVGKASCA